MSDGPRDTDLEFWHAKGKLAPVERMGLVVEKPMTLDELQQECHAVAVDKGWWDGGDRNIGEVLALIHSEISEALEEYRIGGTDQLTKIRFNADGKPEGFFVELADAVIRIADLFERYGVNMEYILRLKMSYNRTRPYRHGGKRA